MEWTKALMEIELSSNIKISLIIDVNDNMDNEDVEKEAGKMLVDRFGINYLEKVAGYELHPYE
jgi:hypothetical protein